MDWWSAPGDVISPRWAPWLLAAMGMLLYSGSLRAETPDAWRACLEIADAGERLRCYDENVSGTGAENADAPVPVLTQRIEKERDLARRAFAVLPHRPNYVLFSYMHEPNTAPFLATDPDVDLQHQEIKFQISLRVPLWNKMFRDNGDFWFAYTQQSYWQAFNWEQSAPFRETNYEPELGISFKTDLLFLGLRHRLLSFGFAHQSNGQGDPLSRSWNRLWVMFELERGNLALTVKPWYRIPEAAAGDNNPDLEDYAGRVELRAAYKHADHVVSATLRNSLRLRDNRSGYEIDWSFPFSRRIKGLVQFYNGFGESLIDYNERTRRLGFGVLVEDWL
jgi:phospholipase A1